MAPITDENGEKRMAWLEREHLHLYCTHPGRDDFAIVMLPAGARQANINADNLKEALAELNNALPYHSPKYVQKKPRKTFTN